MPDITESSFCFKIRIVIKRKMVITGLSKGRNDFSNHNERTSCSLDFTTNIRATSNRFHAANIITTDTSDVDEDMIIRHYVITKCAHKKKFSAKSKNDREQVVKYFIPQN